MKNRVPLISLVVVLAISVGLVGCDDGFGPPPLPSALIVGTARDTDESLAIFEQVGAGSVMREFIDEVNTIRGGVYLSQYAAYADLEIDRREINVATWDIGDITTEICADIDSADVHFLWGGPGIDSIYSQAPIANAANVVLLTFEGGATSLVNTPYKFPWPYVFITQSYSDWYQLPVLAKMLEDKLPASPGTVKAYVVHIHGLHGDEYLQVCDDYFDVVGEVEVPFDPGGLDADTVVLGAMAALNVSGNNNDYDIFCCFAYPEHVVAITEAAMTAKFNPSAMIFGPGANFGYYAYSFGDPPDPALVEGILTFAVASYNKTSPYITEVYDAIAARMDDDAGDPDSGIPGLPLPGALQLDYWGTPLYWAGLQMWLEAVENVGYFGKLAQDELRYELASLNISTVLSNYTWFRMYGAPGAGGGNLDYLCHTGEIGQWQNATLEIVGYPGIMATLPNYVVTANFTFPMTDKWEWLP